MLCGNWMRKGAKCLMATPMARASIKHGSCNLTWQKQSITLDDVKSSSNTSVFDLAISYDP